MRLVREGGLQAGNTAGGCPQSLGGRSALSVHPTSSPGSWDSSALGLGTSLMATESCSRHLLLDASLLPSARAP